MADSRGLLPCGYAHLRFHVAVQDALAMAVGERQQQLHHPLPGLLLVDDLPVLPMAREARTLIVHTQYCTSSTACFPSADAL